MKKLIPFLFMIILTSCSDFLDEKPISNVSVGSFFETSDQFEQAVNGAYRRLHAIYSGESGRGAVSNFTEIRSDNSTYQYNPVHQGWYKFGILTNLQLCLLTKL